MAGFTCDPLSGGSKDVGPPEKHDETRVMLDLWKQSHWGIRDVHFILRDYLRNWEIELTSRALTDNPGFPSLSLNKNTHYQYSKLTTHLVDDVTVVNWVQCPPEYTIYGLLSIPFSVPLSDS